MQQRLNRGDDYRGFVVGGHDDADGQIETGSTLRKFKQYARLHVARQSEQGDDVERKVARVQQEKIEQEDVLNAENEIDQRHCKWTSAITCVSMSRAKGSDCAA